MRKLILRRFYGPTEITDVWPRAGDADGGTIVTVRGRNLTPQSVVGESALTNASVSSDGTVLTGKMPFRGTPGTVVIGSGIPFEFIDETTTASNNYVWWDADNAVDDGTGLANSVPNSGGAVDTTRNLVAHDFGPFAGLKPRIYSNALGGHKTVGEKTLGLTGRSFVNAGGGSFNTPLTVPSTWYITAYVDPTGGVKYFRLGTNGSSANTHGMSGGASGGSSFNFLAGTGGGILSAIIPPGWHIICVVYDGVNGAVYVDSMGRPVASGNIGSQPCMTILTGAFYNDPAPWQWAAHGAFVGVHDQAMRERIAIDYLADRYDQYSWRLMASSSPWHYRDGARLEWFLGRLWLFGGWDTASNEWGTSVPGLGITTNDSWVSDDYGKTWTKVYPHTPNPPTSGAGAHWRPRHTAGWCQCVVGGINYLYLVGSDVQDGGLPDVWRTADGLNWERITGAAPWGNRFLHMVAELNGAIYVMGGQTVLSDPTTARQDVWRSTDGGYTWTQLADAPWAKRGAVYDLVTQGGFIWLAGGGTYDTDATPGRTYYNDVWKFDGTTWTQVLANGHAQWTGREYVGFRYFDNRFWILGGFDGANQNDVYFSGDCVTWEKMTQVIPWVISHADGFAVTPRGLIKASGNTDGFNGATVDPTVVHRLEAHGYPIPATVVNSINTESGAGLMTESGLLISTE